MKSFTKIYHKLYKFLVNYNYLFVKQDINLIQCLQDTYQTYPQTFEIDLQNVEDQNQLYLHILQFTNEELILFKKYNDFFNNLLNNKELFFTNDYLIVNHHEELDVYNYLITQLYDRSSSINFTKNGLSNWNNLLHNGGICETNLESMNKMIPMLRNFLNNKDLYLSNEATIAKQFNQSLNLVRQNQFI